MGSAQPKAELSVEEYLDFCDQEAGKYEYYRDEIFAMAGGMPNHNAIVAAVQGELYARLKHGRCRIFSSDQRIQIVESGLFTYPDVSVFCAAPQHSSYRKDTLTNPTLLIEVLSPGTEFYDQTAKFDFYKKLPSLMQYLMVASEKKEALCYTKCEDHSWRLNSYSNASDEIDLQSVGCTLILGDLYSMVVLPVLDRRPGQ